MIDSGSTDGSLEIARAADGVELLEIPPHEFGHGRTRNLGAERTSGELICFLTQDATPVPGLARRACAAASRWTSASARSSARTSRAPDTSPMIARELERPSPASRARTARRRCRVRATSRSSPTSTPAYRRDCWEQIRFRDVAYSEDQAFGRDLLAAGWLKAYHPDAAVLHAHDYGAARVHAPLLRRVPRAARDDRPRRGVPPGRRAAHRARGDGGRPALAEGPGRAGGRARSLGCARERAPRRPARLLRARLARRAAARAAARAALAGGARRRRGEPARGCGRAGAERPPRRRAAPRGRLRRRSARAARGAGAAARPDPRDGRARAAAARARGPAVRGAAAAGTTRSSSCCRGWSAAATSAACGSATSTARRRTRGRRSCATRSARGSRPSRVPSTRASPTGTAPTS